MSVCEREKGGERKETMVIEKDRKKNICKNNREKKGRKEKCSEKGDEDKGKVRLTNMERESEREEMKVRVRKRERQMEKESI